MDARTKTVTSLFYPEGMVASGQLLLEQGASLEVKDKAGRTPLLGAAQGGHTNMLELLQVLMVEQCCKVARLKTGSPV